jgi:hypothetical protein
MLLMVDPGSADELARARRCAEEMVHIAQVGVVPSLGMLHGLGQQFWQ